MGTVALGIPKETSDKDLEEAEDTVMPLVDATTNIVDDGLLLVDEYPEETAALADPPASP